MHKQVAYLWELYYRRETAPGYEREAFWYCRTQITREDIQRSLNVGNFHPVIENDGQFNGDRDWHVKHIATFVNFLNNGGSFEPIKLNSSDDTPSNGCHRLYAYWYLDRDGTTFVEVTYEQ